MRIKGIKAPRLVVVAVFTTITLVFWVFYNLYGVLTSTPASKVSEELLLPINPQLDSELLNQLGGRVFFEEGEVETIITPTPALPGGSETPEESGELTTEELESETATATATISPTETSTPTPAE